MKTKHSTREQNLVAIRERYRVAQGRACALLGRWLLDNCTDDELAAIFAIPRGQVNALRTRIRNVERKLASLEEKLAELEAVVGE
jgi:hypothetical protein